MNNMHLDRGWEGMKRRERGRGILPMYYREDPWWLDFLWCIGFYGARMDLFSLFNFNFIFYFLRFVGYRLGGTGRDTVDNGAHIVTLTAGLLMRQ